MVKKEDLTRTNLKRLFEGIYEEAENGTKRLFHLLFSLVPYKVGFGGKEITQDWTMEEYWEKLLSCPMEALILENCNARLCSKDRAEEEGEEQNTSGSNGSGR